MIWQVALKLEKASYGWSTNEFAQTDSEKRVEFYWWQFIMEKDKILCFIVQFNGFQIALVNEQHQSCILLRCFCLAVFSCAQLIEIMILFPSAIIHDHFITLKMHFPSS